MSQFMILVATTIFILSSYRDVQLVNAESEFLLVPQDQYILEGGVANITCEARTDYAYWTINGTALGRHHQSEQQRLESMGVVFQTFTTDNPPYYNLTMTIPACVGRLLNEIICNIRRTEDFHVIHSEPVRILVFETFRPPPPGLNIDVTYHQLSPPQVTLKLTGQPLWPGYTIQEFNLTITDVHNGSIREEVTIQNDFAFGNNSVSWQMPLEFSNQPCSVWSVSATAFSFEYGESESAQQRIEISQVPGNFTDDRINCAILFHSNGSLSHVSLEMELPALCSYQPINYTVVIKEIANEDAEVIIRGPYSHIGSGVVYHDIRGLKMDTLYSVAVMVETPTGTSESESTYFNTASEFHSCTDVEPSGGTPVKDSLSFEVVLSVSLIMAVVILVSFLICALVCYWMVKRHFFTKTATDDRSANRMYNSMVPNPIYDGPVYDRVQPQFDALSAHSNSLSKKSVSPQTHGNLLSTTASTNPCFDRDEELPHLPHLISKSPSSSNVYTLTDSPHKIDTSTGNPPALKKNGQERNKLHLTLPNGEGLGGGVGGGVYCTAQECAETYVKMSRVGTLRSKYEQEN